MKPRKITVNLSYDLPCADGRSREVRSRSFTVKASSQYEAFELAERELKRELLLAAAEVKPWCNYYENPVTGARS